MRRLFAVLTMLVALVALSVPSAAMGSHGFSGQPTPVLLLEDNGHYVRGPCLITHGSSRMICRPDIGVLPVAVFVSPPPAAPFAPVLTDPVAPTRSIEPGLPPPRLA